MHAGTGLRLRGLTGNELHVMVAPLPHWSEPFGAHACGAVFISNPASALQSLEGVLRSHRASYVAGEAGVAPRDTAVYSIMLLVL